MSTAVDTCLRCNGDGLVSVGGIDYLCPNCHSKPDRLESAHARKSDPVQSHIAAASVKVSTSEEFVLGCMKDLGKPVLDEDLIAYIRETYPDTNYTDSRIRTARAKLIEKGFVRFAGMGRSKRDKPSALHEVCP